MLEKQKLDKKREKKVEEERRTRLRNMKFNQEKTAGHREKVISQVK